MNTAQIRGQGGGMGLPFGFAGNVSLADDPKIPPWPMLSTGPSSTDFKKMLAELAFGQHLKQDQATTSGLCLPNSRVSDRHVNPVTYDRWIQQLQSAGGHYNDAKYGEIKDSMSHYPQHIALNGGALVLDTARGELVNSSKMTPKEILEAKALAASKSHSEAERRRRERINTHLATLRTLLPSSTKTDKASLLAEVIDQVKMLKRQVSEIYELGPMPTDVDELMVEKDAGYSEGRVLLKASLCCDDRPNLMSDLIKALDSLGLRTLKAEISTLAGRVKNVFFMTLKDVSAGHDQEPSISCIQEALRQVMERPAGGEPIGTSNKRQRLTSLDPPGCGSI